MIYFEKCDGVFDSIFVVKGLYATKVVCVVIYWVELGL